MSDLLEKGFETQARSLRDYGYSDITADRVRETYHRWLSGEKPTDIIDMFCAKAFEDHPQIFGKRPA